MRSEEITYKALQLVGNDRYKLTAAISQRANELSKGTDNLLDIDTKNMKFVDIALIEIAEEKLLIEE